MYYIIGKKDNKDCCWFGAYDKKTYAQKDIKQLRARLPMFTFRISSKYRKNYANFIVQGAIALAPYLTKFAKHIPKLVTKLKPMGKVAIKNLKKLPSMIKRGLKSGSDWLPSVLLVLSELKEIAPDNETVKQLNEMGKTAKEIDKKAKELQDTIPK